MDIERFAIMAAKGNNGGEWATHYTEEQKEYWRQFVREVLAAERERCAQVVLDLLQEAEEDPTWWDVAGVVEKIRKGEDP